MNGTEKMNKVWLLTSSSTELDATERCSRNHTKNRHTCTANLQSSHQSRSQTQKGSGQSRGSVLIFPLIPPTSTRTFCNSITFCFYYSHFAILSIYHHFIIQPLFQIICNCWATQAWERISMGLCLWLLFTRKSDISSYTLTGYWLMKNLPSLHGSIFPLRRVNKSFMRLSKNPGTAEYLLLCLSCFFAE